MTTDQGHLAPEERRALLSVRSTASSARRSSRCWAWLNTAIIVRETGEAVFGLVSLVATITLLFPFADLGIGATVLSASAMLGGEHRDRGCRRHSSRLPRPVRGGRRADRGRPLRHGARRLERRRRLRQRARGPLGDHRRAMCIFALTIPAGLGPRILVGIDRNPLATLVLMSCPAFGLGLTLLLVRIGASGIWYAVSALGGLLIGQIVGTVLALRLSGLGSSCSRRCRLLERAPLCLPAACGCSWWGWAADRLTGRTDSARAPVDARGAVPLRVDGADLCRRLAGAVHRSARVLADLRQEAGRHRSDRSNVVATHLRTFARGGAARHACAWCCSGRGRPRCCRAGRSTCRPGSHSHSVPCWSGRSLHLPASVLLTRPNEARWQALWTVAMAVISIGLGCWR